MRAHRCALSLLCALLAVTFGGVVGFFPTFTVLVVYGWKRLMVKLQLCSCRKSDAGMPLEQIFHFKNNQGGSAGFK